MDNIQVLSLYFAGALVSSLVNRHRCQNLYIFCSLHLEIHIYAIYRQAGQLRKSCLILANPQFLFTAFNTGKAQTVTGIGSEFPICRNMWSVLYVSLHTCGCQTKIIISFSLTYFLHFSGGNKINMQVPGSVSLIYLQCRSISKCTLYGFQQALTAKMQA